MGHKRGAAKKSWVLGERGHKSWRVLRRRARSRKDRPVRSGSRGVGGGARSGLLFCSRSPVVVLCRFVSALTHIYLGAGSSLRVKQTPLQQKTTVSLMRAKCYYDLQSQQWVAIHGFEGDWGKVLNGDDDAKLAGAAAKSQVGGAGAKFSSKNVVASLREAEANMAAMNVGKTSFNAGEVLRFAMLKYQKEVNAEQQVRVGRRRTTKPNPIHPQPNSRLPRRLWRTS